MDAKIEKLQSSTLDPDMIEDEVLRLSDRKRELETNLELFNARGV